MRKIIVITLMILLQNCRDNLPTGEWSREEVELEIINMLEEYHGAIASGGLTAEFEYLDDSSDFFWVPPGYTSALDIDSVRSILTQNAAAFKTIIFSWDTLKIYPLSAEAANYTGIVSGSIKDTSGIINNVRLIESGTLIKRKDGWKLLNGQTAALDSLSY